MALRLLLADEGSSIKKAFEIALKDYGVQIKAVHQGVDVQEVFESFQPDICFIDALLPKLNGYEACSLIKKESDQKNTPIIIMWSGFMELDQEKFKASGASESLEKPFESKTLRDLVKKLIPRLNNNEIANHLMMDESDSEEDPIEEVDMEALEDINLSSNEADAPPPLPPPLLESDEEIKEEKKSKNPPPLEDIPAFDDILKMESPSEDENDHFDFTASAPAGFGDYDPSDSDDWTPENLSAKIFQVEPNSLEEDYDSYSVSDIENLDINEEVQVIDSEMNEDPFDQPEDNDPEGLPPIPVEIEKNNKESIEPHLNLAKVDSDVSKEAYPQLSKEEVKRLVLSQSKDIIESVVWDIVPELAKEMIEKEIKRLTGEISYEGDAQ